MRLLLKKIKPVALLLMAAATNTMTAEVIEVPAGWTHLTRQLVVNTPEGEQEVEITYYRNNVGMEFVLIPPGKYWRGSRMSPEEVMKTFGGHDYWYEREHPRHEVELTESYWLASTPVTQAQWSAVMEDNPSYFVGESHPVDNVSWNDAIKFIRKLSAIENVHYRLPTEAEWEYAARAGTDTEFHFGDEADMLGDFGWYYDNSLEKTHPVGQKQPNAWGLYDLHGNVWEWCSDWFGEYCSGLVINPQGSEDGQYRVLRGGAWFAKAGNCRSARRRRVEPDHRGRGNGLRVAAALNRSDEKH